MSQGQSGFAPWDKRGVVPRAAEPKSLSLRAFFLPERKRKNYNFQETLCEPRSTVMLEIITCQFRKNSDSDGNGNSGKLIRTNCRRRLEINGNEGVAADAKTATANRMNNAESFPVSKLCLFLGFSRLHITVLFV